MIFVLVVVLGFEISDNVATGLGKRFQAIWKAALKAATWLYHRDIFPRHFFNSNRSRYRMQARSQFYLKVIKPRRGLGTGRFVDNVLKGTSRRRMLNYATVRAADDGNSVILRMQAPSYFTNPFVGTYTDDKGQRKTIGHQPDKAKEVTQVNPEDRESFGKLVQRRIMEKFESLPASRKRVL